MKKILIIAILAMTPIAGCGGTNASTVSKNISQEADKFHVGRRIVVTNDITDKTIFEVTGRCSFKIRSANKAMDVTCKDVAGKHPEFTKATIGLGDNTSWASVQLGPINVSQYRTKIVFRPTSVIPDIDLVTGDQAK